MDRYHRQRLLPGIGDDGQARLGSSHALIVGCGALGCTAADLLARAGVGTLTIVDRDLVEGTNLQRQVLFDEGHIDQPKAAAAAQRLSAINSGVRVAHHIADFSAANAERIATDATGSAPDVILDGTDNFETRFLINDLAVKLGLPYLYAGAVGTHAMAAAFLPPFGSGDDVSSAGPCLRCVFDGPPPAGSQPTCDTAGVLGPVISVIAGVQAAEAIKLLSGNADAVRGTLLEFDAWGNTLREVGLAGLRDPGCPCCVHRSFDALDAPGAGPVSLCGRDAMQISPGADSRVDLGELAERLRPHGAFTASRYLVRGELRDEKDQAGGPVGLTVFADGRAMVRGVQDAARARSIYARYVGS